MSRRFALIVGINHYQDTTFQPLHFAENDARALAQWLVNKKGGQWLPADVQFVQGAHATHALIESLIKHLCLTQAGPDDLVCIYFAGHVFLDERSGAGCLALADTHSVSRETALQLAPLAQHIMTSSRAARILFFIDAFQSGPLWSIRRTSPFDMQPLLGPSMIQGLSQMQNRVVLCSCRGNEHSAEVGEQALGLLMHRTIVGLSGQAHIPGNDAISLQSLHNYLDEKLDSQQRPQVFGQAQNPFILIGPDNAQQASPEIIMSSTPPSSFPYRSPERTTFAESIGAKQKSQTATATAQLSPSQYTVIDTDRTTSGQLTSSAIEHHRSQQVQQLLKQATQALQSQQPIVALQIVNQALNISPNDTDALILKTQILGTAGRTQEALASVEQLIQRDSTSVLAWSMQAVILTNAGQHQAALEAIEHALELDSSNPETHTIKTNIMSNIASQQNLENNPKHNSLINAEMQTAKPRSFFIAFGLHIFGVLMGIVGGILPIIRPTLPMWLSFLLESFGLALLCVNAARGTFRHGFLHLIPPVLLGLFLAAILGVSVGYHPAYRKIIFELQAHTNLLLPLLFLAAWIALAAVLPFILALIGLAIHLLTGAHRKKA